MLVIQAGTATGQMKLLSPTTGWVIFGKTIYWTSNGGTSWKDITPAPVGIDRSAIELRSTFFRDTSEGWIIVAHKQLGTAGSRAQGSVITTYSVEHTLDAGTTWSHTALTYPSLPESLQDTFAGPADVFFLDSQHGWMDVAFEGNSRPGKLLSTDNGGNSWHWINSPPYSGSIVFTSLQDGWLVGGWAADQLYVTHDGAKTWNEFTPPAPAQAATATRVLFEAPPVFEDPKTGFLAVRYLDRFELPSHLIIYSTSDGGQNWRIVKVFTEPPNSAAGVHPFDIVDSILLIPTAGKGKDLKITPVALTGGASSNVTPTTPDALRLTFADTRNGWAMSPADGLLATHDGGTTWNSIAPQLKDTRPSSRTMAALAQVAMDVTPTTTNFQPLAGGSGLGASSHITRHLGFDMSYVRPVPDMKIWWNYSPYYDTYIYLPGSHNRGVDNNLNSSWVTQVNAQGWGIIPIWFGDQASCANSTFSHEFDATTAASDGKSEADSAASAATALGLSGTIIYKDVENYDTTNTQCGSSVTAFVSAWISELHVKGYFGGFTPTMPPPSCTFRRLLPHRTQFG